MSLTRRRLLGTTSVGAVALIVGCTSDNSSPTADTAEQPPAAPATQKGRIDMTDEVLWWSAVDQLAAMDEGRFTSTELTEAYLDRIEQFSDLNAFVEVDAAGARAAAKAADERRAAGERTPVLGLSVAIKDLIDVAGLHTTYGSKIFESNVASADAPAVRRLREAGAVILGKVNTTEFALSSPSTLDGASLNPWDRTRTAGGSSNGSGTAAAAALCSFAVGTDTAGSIRTPAAFQGVYGLKPTHGRVSTEGVGVLSTSMDTVGPLARSVDDIALALEVLAGYEPTDATSVDQPVPRYRDAVRNTDRLVVAAPSELPDDVLSNEVRAAWTDTLDRLGSSGVVVREVELPPFDEVMGMWRGLAGGEALLWHEPTLASDASRYSDGARGILESARGVTALDHARAEQDAHRLLLQLLDVMGDADVIIFPTSAVAAPPITEVTSIQVLSDGRPIPADYIGPRFMMPFNVTGQPALTVPVAIGPSDLPIAVQLVGRPFDEATVLRAGQQLASTMKVDLQPLPLR
jgi:aspartyl-tRNA(Asn)/glutamyl-tRNA(Gln) amidotransferase subunit A